MTVYYYNDRKTTTVTVQQQCLSTAMTPCSPMDLRGLFVFSFCLVNAVTTVGVAGADDVIFLKKKNIKKCSKVFIVCKCTVYTFYRFRMNLLSDTNCNSLPKTKRAKPKVSFTDHKGS